MTSRPSSRHLRAAVLAAGDGGRLRPLTEGRPKALVPVAGRALIEYVLRSLREAGVVEALVVVGYEGAQLREHVGDGARFRLRVTYAENEAYTLGNARSIWTAARTMEPPFLVAMADHLMEPGMVARFAHSLDGLPALGVDGSDLGDGDDAATRVLVEDGRVRAVGKRIEPWNAIDVGLSYVTSDLSPFLEGELRDGEAAAVFAAASRRGLVRAVDLGTPRWLDVDTPADLERAEALARDGVFVP